MREKYTIPQRVDEPFRLFLLTLDEVVLLMLPILVIGFVFNAMVIGFIAGVGALLAIKKFKGEQGHFYLVHLMYWYLPPVVRFQQTPPSYIRNFLG